MDLTGDLLDLLKTFSEDRGVPKDDSIIDKNIVRENDPVLSKNKVKAVLSSAERRRLTEIFTLFSKVYLDFKKREMLENKKSVVSSAVKTVDKKTTPKEEKKGGWLGFLSLLTGGVALVAGAIPLLVGAIFSELGPTKDILSKLGKLGMMGGLALMGKSLAKAFGLTALKRLPILGSLVNFWMAYEEFKGGRNAAGVLELVAGVLNLFPGAGTFLSIGVDILKAYLDYKGAFDEGGMFSNENAIDTLKNWASSIGTWIWDRALYLPILGGIKRFGMAKDAFSSGDYGLGISEIIKGLITFGGGGIWVKGYEILAGFLNGSLSEAPKELTEDSSWSDRMVEWIRSKLLVLPWWVKKPLSWFGLIPDEMVEQTLPPNINENANKSPWYVRMYEWLKDKLSIVPWGIKQALAWFGIIPDSEVPEMPQWYADVLKTSGEITNDVGKIAKDAWDGFGTSIKNGFDKVKEVSKKGVDKIKKFASDIGDDMKDTFKDSGSLFSDVVGKVTDFGKQIFGGGDSALDSMVDNIVGMLGLGGETSEDNNQNKKNTQKKGVLDKVDGSGNSPKSIDVLKNCAMQQVNLLQELVYLESRILKEIGKMNGSPVISSPTISMSLPSNGDTSQLVPVGNNRGGYMSSPYALG